MLNFYKFHKQFIITKEESTFGEKLTPNTSDGAGEKHVPVIRIADNNVVVSVGSVEHPMLDAHYIVFVVLETESGMQLKWLAPGQKPEAEFVVNEKIVAVYEYCNLHGLWKIEVK